MEKIIVGIQKKQMLLKGQTAPKSTVKIKKLKLDQNGQYHVV
jgi:hypothetical protein